MISETQSAFSELLITWYRQCGRPLPWRSSRDPYAIWLSEVILQQTRIQQGTAYYLKFLEHYPMLSDLAAAPLDDVLKLWQGLGYYTRARNLHSTAQHLQRNNNGLFPSDYKSIRDLKGIGDYTAAAISSICFNMAYPVLDGNVYRVMSRILCLEAPVNSVTGKKTVMEALARLIDPTQPGDFNQAMMELGALICTPKSPDCIHCPLQLDCQAFNLKKTDCYPVPAQKKTARVRHFNFLVIEETLEGKHFTYINKRAAGDIWEGLYEFPLIETEKALITARLFKNPEVSALFKDMTAEIMTVSGPIRHLLTHQTLYAKFYTIKVSDPGFMKGQTNSMRISWDDIHNYPVSRLTENFLASRK